MTESIRSPVSPALNARSPHHHIPSSPSPLGPSNYDAFDEDEDPSDDGEDNEENIYSNFNDLSSTDADVEDYDSLCPFSDSGE